MFQFCYDWKRILSFGDSLSYFQVARDFKAKFNNPGFPILLDGMNNNLLYKYGTHPERLYVIVDGIVEYAGGIGPMYYDLCELEKWIKEYGSKCRDWVINLPGNQNSMSTLHKKWIIILKSQVGHWLRLSCSKQLQAPTLLLAAFLHLQADYKNNVYYHRQQQLQRDVHLGN